MVTEQKKKTTMQLAFSVKSSLLIRKQRTGWCRCMNVRVGSRGHVQVLVIELMITFVVFGARTKQSLPLLHFIPWMISILANKVFYNLLSHVFVHFSCTLFYTTTWVKQGTLQDQQKFVFLLYCSKYTAQ